MNLFNTARILATAALSLGLSLGALAAEKVNINSADAATLDRVLHVLREQVARCLTFVADSGVDESAVDERSLEITRAFLANLPEVRRLLALRRPAPFALNCAPGR